MLSHSSDIRGHERKDFTLNMAAIAASTTEYAFPRVSEMTFDTTTPTDLCEMMKRWGSDKSTRHNYAMVYSRLFEHLRSREDVRVFELGLGTNNTDVPFHMGKDGKPGASLRGWKEFFPKAQIFGADVDARILFTEDRIRTYYCDQTKPAIVRDMWSKHSDLAEDGFDVIVEDGLHTFEANRTFFENSVHVLRPGGIFVIEDLWPKTYASFKKLLDDEWKAKYPHLEFTMLELLRDKIDDNKLLIAQRLY